ncbi:cupin domain-containing protein [Malaciobacter sp. WC5094]
MLKLNYEGITSINVEDIAPKEVAIGVFEYTLWEEKNNKISAIYKFEENTAFPIDSHGLYDEHIYVLSGTFNDGQTDYKKGSYIFNPKGTIHIPQSKEGCSVLVIYMYK